MRIEGINTYDDFNTILVRYNKDKLICKCNLLFFFIIRFFVFFLNYPQFLSAILLSFVRQLFPDYAPTISTIFLAFLGHLCPYYASTMPSVSMSRTLPFAPTILRVSPQLCVSRDYLIDFR